MHDCLFEGMTDAHWEVERTWACFPRLRRVTIAQVRCGAVLKIR